MVKKVFGPAGPDAKTETDTGEKSEPVDSSQTFGALQTAGNEPKQPPGAVTESPVTSASNERAQNVIIAPETAAVALKSALTHHQTSAKTSSAKRVALQGCEETDAAEEVDDDNVSIYTLHEIPFHVDNIADRIYATL